MPKPDLVIFDCDGVLVDSEPPSNRAAVESLARYGLTLSYDECMRLFVGKSMPDMARIATEMGARLPDNWIEELYAETFALLRQGVPLIAGVVDVLDRLEAENIPYCVASNGSDEKMKITLGQNGLWERFSDRMFSAHRLGVSKPDPALFLAAVVHFNVEPSHCVVIEDSPSGAEGARRAGIRCLGHAQHDDGSSLRAEGAEVFTKMAEVPNLLGLPSA